MEEKIKAHIFVSGLVQGVFFRHTTRLRAKESGVVGWVKNLSDGRVEIMVEGDKEKVEELVEWVKKGPPIAKVDKVDVEYLKYVGEFKSFGVEH